MIRSNLQRSLYPYLQAHRVGHILHFHMYACSQIRMGAFVHGANIIAVLGIPYVALRPVTVDVGGTVRALWQHTSTQTCDFTTVLFEFTDC